MKYFILLFLISCARPYKVIGEVACANGSVFKFTGTTQDCGYLGTPEFREMLKLQCNGEYDFNRLVCGRNAK